MKGRIAAALGLGGAALAAYLAFWPIPVRPVSVPVPLTPGYEGVHAVNERLAGLQRVDLGGEGGAESVLLGPDGMLYAAVESGKLLRLNADGTKVTPFAQTEGRILGFAFDAKGNVIAADAELGLLEISPTGQTRLLTDKVGDDPIRFADAVAIAANGLVYLSDASRFDPAEVGGPSEASILENIEQGATGRVLVYDPADGTTRVVARGLLFANGLMLSADQRTLLVAETGRFRVWQIDAAARDLDLASGPSGAARLLFENLPGYPDNLTRGAEGRIWMGFSAPRSADADALGDKPGLRGMWLRLPRALWPLPKPYGHVVAFTEDGRIVEDLQDPAGAYPETTGATETADRLYIQSVSASGLGWTAR